MTGMKDQYFGVEVEMTGITREQAAQALADYFGTEPYQDSDYYGSWYVIDSDGKKWRFMSDSSIRKERKAGTGYERTSDGEYSVEMVSPKLTYAELPKFQECVRKVRKAGAKVNSSCGLHVHVDAANHNRQSLKNLLSIMYSKEDILFKALQVDPTRVEDYCQKVREPVLRRARQLSADETKDCNDAGVQARSVYTGRNAIRPGRILDLPERRRAVCLPARQRFLQSAAGG